MNFIYFIVNDDFLGVLACDSISRHVRADVFTASDQKRARQVSLNGNSSTDGEVFKEASLGRGRYTRQRAQFFPIRTDPGWRITFLFFLKLNEMLVKELE